MVSNNTKIIYLQNKYLFGVDGVLTNEGKNVRILTIYIFFWGKHFI